MTDKLNELLEAAKALLPHLKASTDPRPDTTKMSNEELAVYWEIGSPPLSGAERLRREANEMEAKDAAILRFREAVAKCAPPE